MHILGLDVGTSSVKAAVLDTSTVKPVTPIIREAYELDHPTPEAAEVPAERLWQTVAGAARQAVRQLTNVGSFIKGIACSCLTPALVLLDKSDRPLSPIWTHLDRRPRPVARHLQQAMGAEFLATVGNLPLPGGISVTSYRQQVNDDPYLAHRVRSYLHLNSWLGLRLTGQRAFDPGNASFTGLFNTVTDQQWSLRWCAYFDVDPAWLPPVVSGDTTLGTLRPDAATDLGLPAGVPVMLGVADTSSAILLAQLTADDVMDVVGTTEVIAVLVDRPTPNPRVLTRLLGVGRQFVQAAHNPVGGVALEWLRNLCFRDQPEDAFYEQTIPEAAEHKTRVLLDPPFLGGDRLQIEAHRAAFRELTVSADRMDLLAALLAALVDQHRKALRLLRGDRPPRRVFLTGRAGEVIRRFLPEYAQAEVHPLEEGSLRGLVRLFG
jgi:xylulokinase